MAFTSSPRTRPLLEVAVRLLAQGLEARLAAAGPGVGLFGPSGAGKTSLIEALAGLRPAEGRIAFHGQGPAEVWLDSRRCLPPERRLIGYVPQGAKLFPHLTARENLLASPRATSLQDEIVSALELGPILDRPATWLSGGEAQRVALGRALHAKPRLLFLDEPFTGLDDRLRRRAMLLLRRLDIPLVLASHSPEEHLTLCQEAIIIRNGSVEAQGPSADVISAALRCAGSPPPPNVLAGQVASVGGSSAEIAVGGQRLVVPEEGLATGAMALLSIDPREVILATVAPQGLSARNILNGRVARVTPWGGAVLVEVAVGEISLAAEVTGEAWAALAPASDAGVYLIVKAHSCRVASLSAGQ